MINVCVSWVENIDLKRFAAGGDNYGSLIAFLKSKYFSTIDELHIIINKKNKYFEFAERFFKNITSNYLRKKSFKCVELDLTLANRIDTLAFQDEIDIRSILDAFEGVVENIMSTHYDANINLYCHFGIGKYSLVVFTHMMMSRMKNFVTIIDENTNELAIKSGVCGYDEGNSIQYFRSIYKEEVIGEWGEIPEFASIFHYGVKMSELLDKVCLLAKFNIPILILGESGTGKELIAHAIHKSSNRSKKPMLIINCAAIQEELANAKLFGWAKGAFTGAVGQSEGAFRECDGGTIFLDEIGDLSLETQTKLLRVLQCGEVQRLGENVVTKVDVRIISATNKNLINLISERKFREDLYYRIEVGIVKLPPLRERGGADSLLIAKRLLTEINDNFKKEVKDYIQKKFDKSAEMFISKHSWPGNIRELDNTIRRTCILKEGETIAAKDIKDNLSDLLEQPSLKETTELQKGNPVNLKEMTKDFRKRLILEALKITDNNQSEAAFLLGYKKSQTLNAEMKRLGIVASQKKL